MMRFVHPLLLRPTRWAFLLLLLLLLPAATARAQSCANATIVTDGTAELDSAAVCQATGPWTRDGYQVLVYVTDRTAASEDAWYAQLDQVEADAGLRSTDGFFVDGFALAVNLASDAPWAVTVTLGESLYNTPLDSDDGVNAVKRAVRGGRSSGTLTDGIVQGLTAAYASATGTTLVDGGVGDTLPATATPVADGSGAIDSAESGSSILGWIIGGSLIVAGAGGAAVFAWPRVVSPALAKRKRQQAFAAQLQLLQQRVANLLLACERLLDGQSPQDTVLYSLFAAYGGDQYQDLDSDVVEALRRSQEALRDAFDIRTRLVRPDVAAQRSLEQQVGDWETVYVTLAGNSPRIRAMTDDELHTLLDPLQVLEYKPDDVQLAAQLDTIRAELAGAPLRVDLLVVDPNTLDADGILGNLDNVQAIIGRLQAAEREAPARLDAVKAQRDTVDTALPTEFILDRKPVFHGIAARLAEADAQAERRAYLDVLDTCDALEADLNTIDALIQVAITQQERERQIAEIEAAGFRPQRLPALRQELSTDLAQIEAKLAADNFDSVRAWLDEYNADGETALAHAVGWRELYQTNAQRLATTRTQHATLAARLDGDGDVTTAWHRLSQYPPLNWQDVEPALEKAREAIASAPAQLDAVDALNTMQTQQFESAELRLTTTSAALGEASLALDEIVGRLSAVESAESSIEAGLRNTEADLRRATEFRDAEDRKIGPEVDTQLDEARDRLDRAADYRDQRAFLAALNEQQLSRELATMAYRTANAQVAQINALQAELDTLVRENAAEIDRMLQAVADLAPVALTDATVQLAASANRALEKAQHARSDTSLHEDSALLTALSTAVAAYQETRTLAQEAHQGSRDDVRSYEQQVQRTRDMLARAQHAIKDAYATGEHRDAGSSWRELASKAERALPQQLDTAMTRERLSRIEDDARVAYELAVKSRSVAQARINTRAQQRMRRRLAAAGAAGRASSRRRSTARKSSPVYRSSSRRSSSSFGSSRRSSSSSFGRSRRR